MPPHACLRDVIFFLLGDLRSRLVQPRHRVRKHGRDAPKGDRQLVLLENERRAVVFVLGCLWQAQTGTK